jgi:hypothetical protein
MRIYRKAFLCALVTMGRLPLNLINAADRALQLIKTQLGNAPNAWGFRPQFGGSGRFLIAADWQQFITNGLAAKVA